MIKNQKLCMNVLTISCLIGALIANIKAGYYRDKARRLIKEIKLDQASVSNQQEWVRSTWDDDAVCSRKKVEADEMGEEGDIVNTEGYIQMWAGGGATNAIYPPEKPTAANIRQWSSNGVICEVMGHTYRDHIVRFPEDESMHIRSYWITRRCYLCGEEKK